MAVQQIGWIVGASQLLLLVLLLKELLMVIVVADYGWSEGLAEGIRSAADCVAVQDLSRCEAACLPCLIDGLCVIGYLFGDRFDVFFFGLMMMGLDG